MVDELAILRRNVEILEEEKKVQVEALQSHLRTLYEENADVVKKLEAAQQAASASSRRE